MITGAAAGIIGMLSGQGIMTLMAGRTGAKLEDRLIALESKELVLKDGEHITRSEVQTAMTGLAEQMQLALNQQAEGTTALIQQVSTENAKAVRIAEARAAATAPSNGAMNAQVQQQMMNQLENLQRQIGA